MGLSRDSRHKARASGGKRVIHQKKRKFELARPPAMTKLGGSRVHTVRTRGGNTKLRALRVDAGSFSWGSEGVSFNAKIMKVVYSATSNEIVRNNTITKGVVVAIDATPFKAWHSSHYGSELTKDESEKAAPASRHVNAKRAGRAEGATLCPSVAEQLARGRLLAMISSRPGQTGVANGYILEGKELEFYKKKKRRS